MALGRRQCARVRAVEIDKASARADGAHHAGLADPCRSGDQHAQIGLGAQLFQQGGLIEGEFEPLGEAAGLDVLALEVVDTHGWFLGPLRRRADLCCGTGGHIDPVAPGD